MGSLTSLSPRLLADPCRSQHLQELLLAAEAFAALLSGSFAFFLFSFAIICFFRICCLALFLLFLLLCCVLRSVLVAFPVLYLLFCLCVLVSQVLQLHRGVLQYVHVLMPL